MTTPIEHGPEIAVGGVDMPMLPLAIWIPIIDGDEIGRAMYERHYSSKKSRKTRARRAAKLFVGPGYKLVLATPCRRAVFAWRKQKHREGVEAAFFRNEGADKATALIRAADKIADRRWPGEKHFTYVDPSEVPDDDMPGRTFIYAGYRKVRETKRGLHVLERPAPPTKERSDAQA